MMMYGPGISRNTLPKGFLSAGLNCGVRKYRPDLGILVSETDAVCAAVFTRNQVQAAPVLYDKNLLPASNIRAIICNSGQANAATGAQGEKDNLVMAEKTAKALSIEQAQVLTASTGVIGVPMQMDKISEGIQELPGRLTDSAENFALAIMTTDLVPKTVATTIELSQGTVTITGIAKGSGMIHPNMATMLGYIATDLILTENEADNILRTAVDTSFNMISVDGETSTNDTVFLMANGQSEVALTSQEDRDVFQQSMIDICQILAQAIARDGEGATKLIEMRLSGCPDLEEARFVARDLIQSPLIKTMVHGEQANWGRILARAGQSARIQIEHKKITITVQGTKVFEGSPCEYNKDALEILLKKDTVKISMDLGQGDAEATAWGCDLSKKYIDINAEYS
jgi:glutamate N-acetyltransferase/amino-acid N-acetyltransferase